MRIGCLFLLLCLVNRFQFAEDFLAPLETQISNHTRDLPLELSKEVWLEKGCQSTNGWDQAYCLTRALQQNHDSRWDQLATIYYLRGKAWVNLAEEERAFEDFQTLLKKHPTYIEPYLEQGMFFLRKNEIKKAYRLIRKGQKKASRSLQQNKEWTSGALDALWLPLLLTLEGTLVKRKNLEKSRTAFLKHLSQHPVEAKGYSLAGSWNTGPESYFLLAWCDYQLGDLESSREYLTTILTEDWEIPSHPWEYQLIQDHPPFRNFLLEEMAVLANKIWQRSWTDQQKSWLQQKWQQEFQKSSQIPVT